MKIILRNTWCFWDSGKSIEWIEFYGNGIKMSTNEIWLLHSIVAKSNEYFESKFTNSNVKTLALGFEIPVLK